MKKATQVICKIRNFPRNDIRLNFALASVDIIGVPIVVALAAGDIHFAAWEKNGERIQQIKRKPCAKSDTPCFPPLLTKRPRRAVR
ncbi:MAG: hypothetical protein JKY68_03690 [Rhodospirillales bacterium]|nr:hypothetical protein [Rhodospirillales bacterium]